MRLVKYRTSMDVVEIGAVEGNSIVPFSASGGQYQTLTDIFEADDPAATADFLRNTAAEPLPIDQVTLLAPIDRQEIWAAGVTYKRSRTARMEESAGSASCYDMVYGAARPELFLKSTPNRVVGPDRPVRIRRDSKWNVPEPELALVLNSRLELVGYTVGNDMSSRDIEGENPLYLPQAKVYDESCALGPCVTLEGFMPKRHEIGIRLAVLRDGEIVFEGGTDVGQMARSFESLVEYLGRDNTFHEGAFLLTGTGIVPSDDFTLRPGDVVDISIDGIGTLANPVVQG